jgi:hypothetical protein
MNIDMMTENNNQKILNEMHQFISIGLSISYMGTNFLFLKKINDHFEFSLLLSRKNSRSNLYFSKVLLCAIYTILNVALFALQLLALALVFYLKTKTHLYSINLNLFFILPILTLIPLSFAAGFISINFSYSKNSFYATICLMILYPINAFVTNAIIGDSTNITFIYNMVYILPIIIYSIFTLIIFPIGLYCNIYSDITI